MPIYEFKCDSCGRRFERLCSLGDAGDKISCPQCGTTGPRRIMSGFAAGRSGKDSISGSAGGGGCGGCTSTNCGSCSH